MSRYDKSFQISLLIFQAIMFAGAAFVDMYHLQNEGFRSRADARKTFYHRVRLLYDYRYESDVVAVMHALLIVTYSAGETESDLAAPPTIPAAWSAVNTNAAFPFQPQDDPNSMHHMMAGMTREGNMGLTAATSDEMQFPPQGAYSGLCIPEHFSLLH
jgi:hypothetical protein